MSDAVMSDAAVSDERVILPVATPRRTWAAVRELLAPHRALAAGALIALVAGTAVMLCTAPLLGWIVDIAVAGGSPDAVTLPAVLIGAVAIVAGLLTSASVALVARLGETMLATLRERFVDRALHLPLEQVEEAGSGDLTARVTGDVSVIAEIVREGLPGLSRSAMSIVLTLGALAVLDWRFFAVALLAVPIQAQTARWYVRTAVPLYARHRTSIGAQQQQLLDSVGGASTVRAYRLGEQHTELVTARSNAAVDLALQGIRLVTRFYGRLNLAEFIGLSAVLVAGFLMVRADAVTIGAVTAAALYFHNLFGPINVTLGAFDDTVSAAASLSRLVGVADMAESERRSPTGVPAGSKLEASGIGHAYVPGHPVLRSVDIVLDHGETVALVGASGAGKSTLAKIIAGIHEPAEGTITLGGTPLDGQRGAVALITQEVHVFAGSLADDLRLARPDAGAEQLRAALARVGALQWAEALPDGLDTVVGEGARRLTVTQSQQLALARLVLADPPVAILDEATAEAGSAGARTLEASAGAALAGRTALVVAHRLTQAAAADRIVLLDAGRVVESGTHDDLLAAAGPYARLWAVWTDLRPEPAPAADGPA
ncbi:ABC transporter ATP-binding protein [Pseudonocardia sp. TRM90224]|uniref:ABC transporter ATP-binding protein n=1 Tax=Pseudonocardia sp. TRM90224 TaxID=2812678 RepID=UPI001E28A704|nr:ABC transporter ATP-binding protein [Pseudonocardia sp. TRM90224]